MIIDICFKLVLSLNQPYPANTKEEKYYEKTACNDPRVSDAYDAVCHCIRG